MSAERRDDILIAVALTRFSVQFEDADPELAEYAWQLAADRLFEYDVAPSEALGVLKNINI
ncbi:hypothetical protein [Halostagnicola sp. A-GB9-2]|uniref:hypothetical protein n=1 Tax=Halostagnicola sp. A-GB9-2 TaxID=3048066 RepID=UPI0024BF1832|nr:hypothetical protein [Halostagnicola sp. A-GB9-2]MDJ1433574.1 hypothetical protein [Halostagnicola sp. A-GB9-2]